MPNDKGSFAGKVAFVTGAANGIGRAAALAFAREGARRCFGAGQPGNGPHDRGGRRAGASGQVRRIAGRGREGRPGPRGSRRSGASTSPSTLSVTPDKLL